MTVSELLNARSTGVADGPALVFLHGFGCGQHMWRHVAPAFEATHRVVLFDLPGSGAAHPRSYDPRRHASLEGYRDDVVALLDDLGLDDVTLVGHSVSAIISVLVQIAEPRLVDRLVLVTPSARYLDDGDYHGGFSAPDIDELLELVARNQAGWQDPLAALISAAPGGAVRAELEASFCAMRPDVAAQFAAVTFTGDNSADLARVTAPTLVVQASRDLVAPLSAGEFVREHIPGAVGTIIDTSGHAPHLSAPEATIEAVQRFLTTA